MGAAIPPQRGAS
jgi:flagellar biosynthesis protein FliQ